MTITANWEVTILQGTENFDLDDMNCQTIEQWQSLSIQEQKDRIQEALDRLPERTFIYLTHFNEID